MVGRILVVDDHKEIAEVYDIALSDEYEMGFAATANEAAGLVAQSHYDLVFMDIALRRSSGVTAALALRGLGYTGPIIAVTGGLMPVDDVLYSRADFVETLTKPVMPSTLREIAHRFVEPAPSQEATC